MGLQGAVRRHRRSHLLAAASVMVVILVVGLILEILPGSGPEIRTAPQQVASNSATPFGQAFTRGIEAMRLGDAQAAVAAFDQARAINPHVAEAHANLGFAYLAMERASEAASAFDRALTINPRQINAYYGHGAALEAAGDRKGAMGAMRTFVHLAAKDDPFRRKALSALWEWEAADKGEVPQQGDDAAKAHAAAAVAKTEAPQQGDEASKAHVAAATAKPQSPQLGGGAAKAHAAAATAKSAMPAPAPLPAIAETPDALTPPEGMISIVNFWASWCGPCRAEMPSLQAFAAALDPMRYRLVGLNIDKDRDFAREFIRDTGVSFGNFWDGKGAFARERFQVESYPQTLFLDSSGAVLARVIGAREWPADAAERTVSEILTAGRQKTEPK